MISLISDVSRFPFVAVDDFQVLHSAAFDVKALARPEVLFQDVALNAAAPVWVELKVDLVVAWRVAFADHVAVVQPVDSGLVYSAAALAEPSSVAVTDDYPFVGFQVADGWQADHDQAATQVVIFWADFVSVIEHLNVFLSPASPLSNHTLWKAQVFYPHCYYFLFVDGTSAIPLCSSADQAYCIPLKEQH